MEWKFIGGKFAAFAASSMFILLGIGFICLDAWWLDDGLHENSFTEIAQELILALIAFLLLRRARRDSVRKPALVLMAGFFTVLWIREMDFAFDLIAHGCWLWFALVVTALSLFYATRHLSLTLAALADFMRRPAWGMMCAGLLTILVFSRLFGMHALWQHLMQGDYQRIVKNMAEEGSELFGYSLCLLATLDYLRDLRRERAGR